MVDVTTEALQTVKNALATFQSEISGLSMRATNDTNTIVNGCKAQITQAKSEIAQVETQISVISRQINELESEIEQTTAQYNALVARIPKLENNIRSMESKISTLNSQIISLRSHLANAESDEERQQIQEQENTLSNKLSHCESEKRQLEALLQTAEQKKSECQQRINSAKVQKAQCESELSVQKNRCNKMKDKFERLRSTFNRVEADLKDYVSATKKFENQAAGQTQRNTCAVEKCLESIEQYLSLGMNEFSKINEASVEVLQKDGRNISASIRNDISNSFCVDPNNPKSSAQQAAEQQGYLGLPTIIDHKHFDEAVTASGFIAYRTINAGTDVESGIYRSSEEFAKQFEEGESISLNGSGQQVYGSGIYVASNSGWTGSRQLPSEEDRINAETDSREYGRGECTTLVLTIAPDTNIGNYQELFSEYCSLSEDEFERFGGYGRDGIAAYAISRGYDGLRIPNAGIGCDYTVIYNRTRIILRQR